MPLSEFQHQVSIGSLLGNMSASKPKNGINYHLSCYHSQKQLNWLEIKWNWLQPFSRPIQYCTYVDKRDGKSRSGGRFHTQSLACFTDLAHLFYGSNGKTIPDNIQGIFYHPVALATLICDDGSWDKAGIQIASKQFSESDNQRLAETICANYGISAYVMKNTKYFSIRIPAKSIEKTFEICRQFIPENMFYKFGGKDYSTYLVGKIEKVCPACGKSFDVYQSANQNYCSVKCAAKSRPSGYKTRKNINLCPICHHEFIPYMKTQITCIDCRDKPFPNELCVICHSPVKSRGSKTCSRSCNVKLGHKHRK